jgi:tetratricopeptide (TPR) repeat protein
MNIQHIPSTPITSIPIDFDAIKQTAEQGQALKALDDPEEHTIQQALAQAVAQRNKKEIAKQLLILARYRHQKGLTQNAEECLNKALTLQSDLPKEIQGQLMSELGAIHQQSYRHNSAIRLLESALELLPSTPEYAKIRGQVFENLAEIAAFRNQNNKAIQHYFDALEASSLANLPAKQAEIYTKLARVYDDMNLLENALNYYQQAFSLEESLQNSLACAELIACIGSIYMEQCYYSKALSCFQQALDFDKLVLNPNGYLKTLDAMASTYLDTEQDSEAERTYQKALTLAKHHHQSFWQAHFDLKLGNMAYEQGYLASALNHYQAALAIATDAELSQQSIHYLQSRIQETSRELSQEGTV